MLRIHDTMAARGVDFVPREPGRASIYVCGPTVYDVPHLGHGRTAVVFDVIIRYLEWSGLAVTYVSNITNVDDRIIARAAREGGSEQDVAVRYEQDYWDQLGRLNVRTPDDIPRATEFVDEMVRLIAELIARGHAYVIEGEGVYFQVDTYPEYGQVSRRKLEDLIEGAGARVDVDEQKRSPVDFALWKAAKPGEPDWESPWGRGRPGWHIECSAMSLEILGESFDLHGGGDDLIFPHHENERAQAEAAGHPFARHWLHSGMVEIGGEKMSKSLNNFVTLADALDESGPRAFRLAVLQTHYRSKTELGPSELGAAGEAVDRLDAFARRARAAGIEPGLSDAATVAAFTTAMDDDFGTPAATAVIFDAVRRGNVAINDGEAETAGALLAAVVDLSAVLGLDVGSDGAGTGHDDAEIDALVAARTAARSAKDFAEADRVRDELAARGVTLEDTADGTIWHR